MSLKTYKQILLVGVNLLMVLSLLFLAGCYEQPPYSKGRGTPIQLINNKSATDPTWDELQEFLLQDTTDEKSYTYSYVCADFAERLHNNAESEGVKAAFVVVNFITGEPHALNAFLTTDKGLVYIDCTGKDAIPTTLTAAPTFIESLTLYNEPSFTEDVVLPEMEPEYDKIALVSKGASLELISLGTINTPSTHDYEKYKQKVNDYIKAVEAYNIQLKAYDSRAKDYYWRLVKYEAQVEAWNSGNWTYSYPAGGNLVGLGFTKDLNYHQLVLDYKQLEKDYISLEHEGSRLALECDVLLSILQTIGYYEWESLGTVIDVKIWW